MAERGLDRRRLLALGGTAAVLGLAAGCSGPPPGLGSGGGDVPAGADCVPRSALQPHRSMAGLPLVYEPDRGRISFAFDAGFFARLEEWAAALGDTLPAAPAQLWTYGSWVDGSGSCDSWHHAGRAFDLARVRLADGSDVSCRYDRWRTLDGSALEAARRSYWSLAAGLHRRFCYVLTYLYDGQHANHIHIDNGRSGDADSTFSPRSRVQVQAVQALCRYRWDEPVELSGQWDSATRRAVGRVLEGLGLDGGLTAAGSWAGLLDASAARGRG